MVARTAQGIAGEKRFCKPFFKKKKTKQYSCGIIKVDFCKFFIDVKFLDQLKSRQNLFYRSGSSSSNNLCRNPERDF